MKDGSAVVVTKQRFLAADDTEVDEVGVVPDVGVAASLLDIKTGLPVDPAAFCSAWIAAETPLFDGPPPSALRPRTPVDAANMSAFC